MLTGSRFWIEKFPRFVDPAAAALELVVRAGSGSDPPISRWVQFIRLDVRHDTFPFPLEGSSVHFFGDSAVPEECRVLLVYDHEGFLRRRYDRDQMGEWHGVAYVEEQAGRPVRAPSVRLVFRSDEDAVRASRILARGSLSSADVEGLRAVLGRAAEPPRLLPVATGEERERYVCPT